MIKKLFQLCRDILFPQYCFVCGKEGMVVCDLCIKKIPMKGVFLCPGCSRATFRGMRCPGCLGQTPLAQHIALAAYTQKHLALLIEQFKYQYQEDVSLVFRKYMVDFFSKAVFFDSVDIVVPVPLHVHRYAERGFNQAHTLATYIAEIFQKPIIDLLVRNRNTAQQARLKKRERVKNVAGAFSVKKECTGKHILLVDDVYTTGSTMRACAEVLLQGGASSVSGWTLAKG